jgi:hypothetical protein
MAFQLTDRKNNKDFDNVTQHETTSKYRYERNFFRHLALVIYKNKTNIIH